MCANNDAGVIIIEKLVSSVLGGWFRRAAKPCTTCIRLWAVPTTSPKHIFVVPRQKHTSTREKNTLVLSIFPSVSVRNGAGSEPGTTSNPIRGTQGSTPVNTISEVRRTPLVSGFRPHAHPMRTRTVRDPRIDPVATPSTADQTASLRRRRPTGDRIKWEN